MVAWAALVCDVMSRELLLFVSGTLFLRVCASLGKGTAMASSSGYVKSILARARDLNTASSAGAPVVVIETPSV